MTLYEPVEQDLPSVRIVVREVEAALVAFLEGSAT